MDQKYKIIYSAIASIIVIIISFIGYYGYYDFLKKENAVQQKLFECSVGCTNSFNKCEENIPSGWNPEFLECQKTFKKCGGECQGEYEKGSPKF
ncbi:MAG: hypothetical protein WC397_03215 [Candidatus Paceibacterota bacterium]|jgi:hypothetical protein